MEIEGTNIWSPLEYGGDQLHLTEYSQNLVQYDAVPRLWEHSGRYTTYRTKKPRRRGADDKMKPDLTESTKVSDGLCDYMVIQPTLYIFIDAESRISKLRTDGTGYAKVADMSGENMFGFSVSGDWIYYGLKAGSVYKIKTDGMEKNKIADISSFYGDMNVSGDWIVYVILCHTT